jgi:hypothetical protein
MKNGLIKDWSGNKFHYMNGKLHRETGPAIETVGGKCKWYFNGVNIEERFSTKITSVEQYQKLIVLMVFE